MAAEITLTLDLEDHRPTPDLPKRYPEMTRRLIDFFDERQISITVFVVGTIAQDDPSLVKEISTRGHEVALHSFDHTPITDQTADEFRSHTERGKKILEDLTGVVVAGYRAPLFSLTAESIWAIDILRDLGFEYSSSTLPAPNPIFGFPNLPQQPFRWWNGLLELPAPIGHFGLLKAPYLGGVYFRYLPNWAIKNKMANAPEGACLWSYCHPYDIDFEEKNRFIKDAPLWVSLLLRFKRKNTLRKLERLLAAKGVDSTPPFRDLVQSGKFDRVPALSSADVGAVTTVAA